MAMDVVSRVEALDLLKVNVLVRIELYQYTKHSVDVHVYTCSEMQSALKPCTPSPA
jgi:hypothetical protein